MYGISIAENRTQIISSIKIIEIKLLSSINSA